MSKRRTPEKTDETNPEWTEEDVASAKPAKDVLPELFGKAAAKEMLKPRRGRPPAEVTKEPVSLRIDPDVLAEFRASGPGWQTKINDALKNWLKEHDPSELRGR